MTAKKIKTAVQVVFPVLSEIWFRVLLENRTRKKHKTVSQPLPSIFGIFFRIVA